MVKDEVKSSRYDCYCGMYVSCMHLYGEARGATPKGDGFDQWSTPNTRYRVKLGLPISPKEA